MGKCGCNCTHVDDQCDICSQIEPGPPSQMEVLSHICDLALRHGYGPYWQYSDINALVPTVNEITKLLREIWDRQQSDECQVCRGKGPSVDQITNGVYQCPKCGE